MSGRHKFSELEAALPPARQARINRVAERLARSLGPKSGATEAVREAAKPITRKMKPDAATQAKVR